MVDGNKHALLKSGFDGFQQNYLMLKAIDYDSKKSVKPVFENLKNSNESKEFLKNFVR